MTLRLFLLLLLIMAQGVVLAQEIPPTSRKPLTGQTSESSFIRESALTTLDGVVDELASIDDLGLRVELTATIVDLLHVSRPDRCRKALDSLFTTAMEVRARRSKDRPSTGNSAILTEERRTDADSAIRKIIQIALGLDRKLGKSYMEAYTDEQSTTREDRSNAQARQRENASTYLKVATQLIERDPNLAILTAEESLRVGVFPDTLIFLASLRKRDVGLANRFFTSALNSSNTRKGHDVNELLLLYSFVFSPNRVPVITPGGIGVQSIFGLPLESYPVDPVLARQFLDISSSILLSSDRYLPQSGDRLAAGVLGDLYTLSLLEGRINEYLPNLAQKIAEHRNVVANYLRSEERVAANESIERWGKTPSEVKVVGAGNSPTVDHLVARAEQSSNSRLKNRLWFQAALAAVDDKQDERALDLVSKLPVEYSDRARQLVIFATAERHVRHGFLPEAEKLARRDEVLVRRCYIFTLIADASVKGKTTDFPRAVRLLDEVRELVTRLNSTEEKIAVLGGVAAVSYQIDRGRAFELLRETISAANKLDDYRGYLSIDQSLNIDGFLFDFSIYADKFDYFDLLGRLAAGDYFQAIQSAREIKSHSLRIHSVVIICKAALNKGPANHHHAASSQTRISNWSRAPLRPPPPCEVLIARSAVAMS